MHYINEYLLFHELQIASVPCIIRKKRFVNRVGECSAVYTKTEEMFSR